MIERPVGLDVPYLALVPQGDLLNHYAEQLLSFSAFIAGLSEPQLNLRYAPGKWSIKEVIGHLTDTERVCSYRLLCAARNDATEMPGFDEEAYVREGVFESRSGEDLLEEWKSVRMATISLLRGLPDGAMHQSGTFKGRPNTALAVACVILGHVNHHVGVLHERYGV